MDNLAKMYSNDPDFVEKAELFTKKIIKDEI